MKPLRTPKTCAVPTVLALPPDPLSALPPSGREAPFPDALEPPLLAAVLLRAVAIEPPPEPPPPARAIATEAPATASDFANGEFSIMASRGIGGKAELSRAPEGFPLRPGSGGGSSRRGIPPEPAPPAPAVATETSVTPSDFANGELWIALSENIG